MKVILDGAYGFNNVGDEAMLHTTIGFLRRIRPGIGISVSSFNSENIKDLHGVEGTDALLPGALLRNLKALRFGAIREQFGVFRSSDVLFFAGGSILNDKKGLRDIAVIFYKVSIFVLLRKKVVFWGVAYDQVDSFFAKAMIKFVMRKSSLVLFRDQRSEEMVVSQLGRFQHVGTGVDILFGMLPLIKRKVSSSSICNKAACRIGLSLRPYPPNIGFDLEGLDASLCEQVVDYIQLLSDRIDRPVVIVPLIFSDGGDARNDRGLIARIESMLDDYQFEWPRLDVTSCRDGGFGRLLSDFCENIGNLDLVVGERFHSLVIAQMLEVPYIAISYDKKIDQLVKSLKMEAYSVNLLESIAARSICSQLLVMTERALSGGFDLEKKLSMNNNLLEKQSKDAEESVLSAFEL